jgi:hypothetical protein
MRAFSKALYPTVRDETFFESCGVADLIATCYGGRNRLVAMEYTKAILVGVFGVGGGCVCCGSVWVGGWVRVGALGGWVSGCAV